MIAFLALVAFYLIYGIIVVIMLFYEAQLLFTEINIINYAIVAIVIFIQPNLGIIVVTLIVFNSLFFGKGNVIPLYILPYLAAVALTLATIYFDKLSSCCCQCWTSAGEYVGVFDPEHPDKEFKLGDGEVVEVTNDVEEGSLGEISDVTNNKEFKLENGEVVEVINEDEGSLSAC